MAESSGESADRRHLESNIASMAQLAAEAHGLEELLTGVAELAVSSIPRAEGAGVTSMEYGQADIIVGSATFVREVDAIQYKLGEGPCISAAAQRRTVRTGSIGQDDGWPKFGPRVGRLGVHSALSLPLLLPDPSVAAVGAINVYAHPRDAFDSWAQSLGEMFAVPAAVAVRNAQILADSRRAVAQVQTATANRAVIDQAIGILIHRHGGTVAEAFESLRATSLRNNQGLATVAKDLVDGADQRPRPPRSNPEPTS